MEEVSIKGSAGYFGKVPCRGDFVRRGLPQALIDAWDSWLQTAIACSREILGDRWLDAYLTSPIWRFVMSPGICGGAAIAGVTIPSVDRVGRYFPLLVASTLSCETSLFRAPVAAQGWFEEVEKIALRILNEDRQIDDFTNAVQALSEPQNNSRDNAITTVTGNTGNNALYFPLSDLGRIAGLYEKWLETLLLHSSPKCSVWWSNGSNEIVPCLLVCDGLPNPRQYTAMLAGNWDEAGWNESVW